MINCGIYEIRNILNDDIYIGSSERLKKRKYRHFDDLKNNIHHSIILQRAYDKYGIDNFKFSTIELCVEENLLIREQYYIDTLNPKYNICKIAGNCKGIKKSKETINKLRQSLINSWNNKQLKTPFSKYTRNRKKEDNLIIRQLKENRNILIVNDLKLGIEQKIIAEKYNLSSSVITQIKKKNNIQTEMKVYKGQNNGWSKLTDNQVIEIKLLLQNKIKQQIIADNFNVKLRTIKAIACGQNWSHITIQNNDL